MVRMVRPYKLAIGALWLALSGCARSNEPPAPSQPPLPKRQVSTVAPIPGNRPDAPIDLPFTIEWSSTAKPEPRWMKWDATYTSHGKTARFRLELTGDKAANDAPAIFGHGYFYHVAGSDCAGLLADLKPVLGAKHLPKIGKPVDKLAFDAAILGVNQSKAPDTPGSFGGFRSDPPGDWMTVKVFLPDDIEFFLNVNEKAGIAEFSIKDEEYGDEILKQLSTVL